VSAFAYLVWSSGRNRLLMHAGRLRRPRYALALIIGGAYIWSFLLRPTGRAGVASALLGAPAEKVVALLVALTLMGSWVFGSDATALAFSPAEVSMLFPAPLSRRALIGYKLFRSQIVVLVNSLIWVFVLRRGGTALPAPLRAVAIWMLFSTLNLHRLGAAIVRSSWREHRAAALRRHRVAIALFAALWVCIAAGLVAHRAELLAAGGVDAMLGALTRVLSAAPASIGLYPFDLMSAPTFAATVGAWTRAIVPAAVLLALHVIWVLRTDAAFEEAAVEASAERARRIDSARARRSGGAMVVPRGTSTSSTLALSATGHPAAAILWKNMLCLWRTARLRLFIGPLALAIGFGVVTSAGGSRFGEGLATSAVMMCAMLLLFGGRLIRNDLRHDMQHLALIKSLPLSPHALVAAEVASAALPMAAVQLVLLLVAYVAALASGTMPVGPATAGALLIAAPFAMAALTGAALTIQNGTAVLFPGWIRLGPAVSTGVEALGQSVLATGANLLALAGALVVPALVAWAVMPSLDAPRPAVLAAGIILAAVVLAVETAAVMRYLGGALARAEPAASE
jgi:hypothetical protein